MPAEVNVKCQTMLRHSTLRLFMVNDVASSVTIPTEVVCHPNQLLNYKGIVVVQAKT